MDIKIKNKTKIIKKILNIRFVNLDYIDKSILIYNKANRKKIFKYNINKNIKSCNRESLDFFIFKYVSELLTKKKRYINIIKKIKKYIYKKEYHSAFYICNNEIKECTFTSNPVFDNKYEVKIYNIMKYLNNKKIK